MIICVWRLICRQALSVWTCLAAHRSQRLRSLHLMTALMTWYTTKSKNSAHTCTPFSCHCWFMPVIARGHYTWPAKRRSLITLCRSTSSSLSCRHTVLRMAAKAERIIIAVKRLAANWRFTAVTDCKSVQYNWLHGHFQRTAIWSKS